MTKALNFSCVVECVLEVRIIIRWVMIMSMRALLNLIITIIQLQQQQVWYLNE